MNWAASRRRSFFPDADLDLAIAGIASAIFYNQGQCCTAGSRLFAHKSIYDRIVNGVVAEAGKLKMAMVWIRRFIRVRWFRKEQHQRVTGFIASGRGEGAEIVTGGKTVVVPRLFRRAHGAGENESG